MGKIIYFQIKMSSNVLPYLGVMTPNRGIRVLTRAGQGLQNSDYELEQLLTQILGDEICQDKVIISRDDGIVGANSMEELIDHWEIVPSKLKLNNMKAAASKLRLHQQRRNFLAMKFQMDVLCLQTT